MVMMRLCRDCEGEPVGLIFKKSCVGQLKEMGSRCGGSEVEFGLCVLRIGSSLS